MRRGMLVSVVVGVTLFAIVVFAASASSKPRSVDRTSSLEQQVRDLQRKVKVLAVLSISHTTQILALQNRRLVAEPSTGGPALISPHSWGTAVAGTCIYGTPVAAGFSTDYPTLMGTMKMSAFGGWTVAAYNPQDRSVLLSTQVVCLTLR
jgi:hypothetical protein